MIKILAVLTLTIMCYLITETLTLINAPMNYWFAWGWISAVVTGFFVNWFIKSME